MLMRLCIPALLVSFFCIGCDSGGGTVPPLPAPPDSIVAGVNLNRLFAAPTGNERIAVRSDWSARDLQLPARYNFTREPDLTGPDGEELHVYAGREPGSGAVFFYGLVRLPIRNPGDVRTRATLLVLPDGEAGTSDHALRVGSLPFGTEIHEEFVYVTMAYRGETLRAGGETFTPDTTPWAYDLEVDDALALIDHVVGAEILADAGRIGVLGVGRGGGVGLLAEFRTNDFDIVIDIAGPANFFASSFRSKTEGVLTHGMTGSFPGLQSIADRVLFPLRDGDITMAEARLALLRRSPSHFVGPPPFIFVAHGGQDFVVH
ncbi:MAG: hypothetical protein WBN32_13510, partial [Woeseia sp.]